MEKSMMDENTNTLIYFKDCNKDEIFEIKYEDAEDFQERYEYPNRLIVLDIWYSDGAGYNGKLHKLCFGKKEDEMKIVESKEDKTNNEAEYEALLSAMRLADNDSIMLVDSKLLVGQTQENWKCNHNHLRRLRDLAIEIKNKKRLFIKWIPRKENLAGIALENEKKEMKKHRRLK